MSALQTKLPHLAAQSDVSVKIGRTVQDVENLRPQFDRLPPTSLDGDIDYFLAVVTNRHTALRPHVMVLELPDGRELRVVARVEERRSHILGRIRRLQVTFGGVVGAESMADCRVVIQALRAALADGDADVVCLPQLPVGSPLYEAARSDAPWCRTDHVPVHRLHWRATVPDSLQSFLRARSSNTRYNVKRYSKRLTEAHGNSLVIREFRHPDDLERVHRDLEAVAIKTYQRGLGVGYLGNGLQRALMSLAALEGWLGVWVLYLEDTPVAFWLGYSYRGTFYLSSTGFDPAFADLRIGQHLQMEMMKSLCADPRVADFDFGIGDAEYKRRFGDDAVAEADVLVFGPSLRAVLLNLEHTARTGAARLARALIARSQLRARVKKAWRTMAQRRAHSRAHSGG